MDEPLPEVVARLAPQVHHNCQLASALGSGRFSLCGLLLRLRNLYKWEAGLAPWREEDSGRMLGWVSEREDLWDEIADGDFQPLELAGESYDPFDHQAINRAIEPLGYIYGAGLAGGAVPVFFLGRLESRQSALGLTVYRLGRELCQDIFLLPGLRQDGNIYLRSAPMPFLLWDRVADPTPSLAEFCRFGLAAYGLDRDRLTSQPSWQALEPVMRAEMDGVLWHELGEATDGALAAEMLAVVVADHPATELEHFVRGVKDLLADTGPQGRLGRIIQAEHQGMLGLYPVWLAGFPRLLFPEIDPAVRRFMASGDWELIEQARQAGWQRAQDAVQRLTPLLAAANGEQLRDQAHHEVIAPLTAKPQD